MEKGLSLFKGKPFSIIFMIYLFLILICGLPFSCFLFRQIDIWHAQGFYFQAVLFVMFLYSFFDNKTKKELPNLPLGVLSLWVGLITLFTCYMTMIIASAKYNGGVAYNNITFLPFFNFLCFLMFYKLSLAYLDKEKIEKILCFLRYSVFIVLVYCGLQALGFDQFIKPITLPENWPQGYKMVGVSGHPTHLAGYLGICLPLFFLRKGKMDFIAIALILLYICFFTTWAASKVAVTGVITSVGVIGWWFLRTNKKIFVLFAFLMVVSGVFIYLKCPDFFNDEGKLAFYKWLWMKFHEKPITGTGLGQMNVWAQTIAPIKGMRHAHFEYLHFAVELGLVGLGLIIFCIYEYFKVKIEKEKRLNLVLECIFVGFLLSCLTTYPAHLWLPASLGMMAYSFKFVLKREELNGSYI